MNIVNSTVILKFDKSIDPNELMKSNFIYVKNRKKKKFNPFNCICLKKPNTKSYFFIYRNGKGILLGCRSLKEIWDAIDWLDNELGTNSQFQFKNFVSSIDLFEPIDLRVLHSKLTPGTCLFEPELFPALSIDILGGKALVFRTGKVIVTGFDNLEDLKEAEKKVFGLVFDQP